ncbi:hypothetical protein [Kitasatospora sp. NPDC094015]|uniref:hypothetical protein n=1 Tax=Kitasatospora sp. NPDC094015 TaxID=3155205 RepID=UPI00331CA788
MVRSRRVHWAHTVGGAVLGLAACTLAVGPASAAESPGGPSLAPEPAAAQLMPLQQVPPVAGSVGGSAGLYAVGGGLVVAAGGAATWLRRRRAGRPTTY